MFFCQEETQDPPNIIYILADDLGYGDLGAFNRAGKIKTPHLDRIIFNDDTCRMPQYGILTNGAVQSVLVVLQGL